MDKQKDRTKIGTILGEISQFEFENDRPLLSSLVIQSGKNDPSSGFYELCEQLGLGKAKNLKKDDIFATMKIKETVEFWSNKLNYAAHFNI